MTFHHEIVAGGTDKSYGIYVAKLAGVPEGVVERAKSILSSLEAHSVDAQERPSFVPRQAGGRRAAKEEAQMGLFARQDEQVVDELRSLDLNALTPIEALVKLKELKEKAR